MKGVCVADLVDRMQQEIDERLNELKPLVEESERLKVAAAALEGVPGTTPVVRTPKASTPARAQSAAPKFRKRGGGRPRGSKNRAERAAPASAPIVPVPVPAPPAAAQAAKSAPATKRRRGSKVRPKAGARKRGRAPLSANQRAIIAALEHGPHTVRELVIVTGMSDQTVRNNVKVLVGLGKVVKTERGGKAAYALPAAVQELAAAA
jgi:DNA-binding transcriptional ArsR family regulator